MRKEAEKELTKLDDNPNNNFTLKFMKNDGKDIEGDRCMRKKNGRLSFSEKDIKRIWKNHMKIMNKENDWDHVTAASMVEEPIKNVTCKEMAIAIKAIKPGKAAGPSEAVVLKLFLKKLCFGSLANFLNGSRSP